MVFYGCIVGNSEISQARGRISQRFLAGLPRLMKVSVANDSRRRWIAKLDSLFSQRSRWLIAAANGKIPQGTGQQRVLFLEDRQKNRRSRLREMEIPLLMTYHNSPAVCAFRGRVA